MVINIRGIAKGIQYWRDTNLPHAADRAYTVTVYADNSNINIQTYADQSGYKTSFVTPIRQEVLNSTDCDQLMP